MQKWHNASNVNKKRVLLFNLNKQNTVLNHIISNELTSWQNFLFINWEDNKEMDKEKEKTDGGTGTYQCLWSESHTSEVKKGSNLSFTTKDHRARHQPRHLSSSGSVYSRMRLIMLIIKLPPDMTLSKPKLRASVHMQNLK